VIDQGALVAWLRTRADTSRPVPYAVYTGIADRITRGDFATDTPEIDTDTAC
jgi:hypothetical protein